MPVPLILRPASVPVAGLRNAAGAEVTVVVELRTPSATARDGPVFGPVVKCHRSPATPSWTTLNAPTVLPSVKDRPLIGVASPECACASGMTVNTHAAVISDAVASAA